MVNKVLPQHSGVKTKAGIGRPRLASESSSMSESSNSAPARLEEVAGVEPEVQKTPRKVDGVKGEWRWRGHDVKYGNVDDVKGENIDDVRGENVDAVKGENREYVKCGNVDHDKGGNVDDVKGKNREYVNGENVDDDKGKKVDDVKGGNVDYVKGVNQWQQSIDTTATVRPESMTKMKM